WTEDPGAMQVLQFVLSAASFGLIWFRSPIGRLHKLLLCLSFQLGYLFSVFSRCYSLGMLLVLMFLSDLPRTKDTAWRGWLVLALLANVHFYFFLTAFVLAMAWLRCRPERRELLHGSGLYFLGNTFQAFCLARIYYATGEELSGFLLTLLWPISLQIVLMLAADLFDPRLSFAKIYRPLVGFAVVGTGVIGIVRASGVVLLSELSSVGAGFFTLCSPFSDSYWNFQTPLWLSLAVLPLAVLCVCACLRGFSEGQWLLLGQSACMVLVFALFHPAKLWHVGVLFLSFLGLVWIGLEATRIRMPGRLLTLLLLFQAVTGVQAMILSKLKPVSAIKQTADWINKNTDHRHLLLGLELFPTSAVSNYVVGRDIYFPHRETTLKYSPWGEWFISNQPPRIVSELLNRHHDKAYLIASMTRKELIQERFAPYSKQLRLTEVAAFDEASAEKFVVFEVTLLR
ncbi:MAG: hypothetical protein KC800_09250, partial [Candidatus Eremiobacteraeota bacterium]|nr:hypothetical protein [Candidatus Eremiobacteraeota bacterium]